MPFDQRDFENEPASRLAAAAIVCGALLVLIALAGSLISEDQRPGLPADGFVSELD